MSRYNIIERPDGFRIEGEDRTPVDVILRPGCFELRYRLPWLGRTATVTLGLYEFYTLVKAIAYMLMSEWQPPDRGAPPAWNGLPFWARRRTAWAICKRVHAQWKRLLAKTDPNVLTVQRAVFSATFGAAWVTFSPQLYEHPHLVSDITNHRAAAAAASYVQYLDDATFEAVMAKLEDCDEVPWLAGAHFAGLHHGSSLDQQPFASGAGLGPAIEALSDWRALFSPTGESYRSLDRTLMNLPGGIPARLVCNLRNSTLVRPVFQRLELLVTLLSFQAETVNQRVFDYAQKAEIKEAMRRVAEHTHNDLSPRRTRDVRFLVRFLVDYPEMHQGNIVGLADKSIRWHTEQREQQVAARIDELGYDRQPARPPIPLPDTDGIRFLDTVGAVYEEGAEMHHCVASYAPRAVHGGSFLFHIDHGGEQATVQIGMDGKILQALGPGNRRNKAAVWGSRTLSHWGRGLSGLTRNPFVGDGQ